MSTKDFAIAIDIGSSKVCAVAGSLDEHENSVNIEGFAERPFKLYETAVQQGKVVNLEKTAELIDEVLTDISRQLGCHAEYIIVSISGSEIEGSSQSTSITRSHANTTVQDDDVANLLSDARRSLRRTPGHALLHILPQDFIVDGQMVKDDPVGRVGITLGGNFYVVTSPQEQLRYLAECIDKVPAKNAQAQDTNRPVSIEGVLFSPIADAISLLQPRDKEGVAIVNIGSEVTELSVFVRQGLQHLAVIPIASSTVTQDIAEAYNLSMEDADMLKLTVTAMPIDKWDQNSVLLVESGDGIPPTEVPVEGVLEIIQLRYKELAAIVKSELLKKQLDQRLPKGIILTGGGANGSFAREIFSDMLDVHTRIGTPTRNISRNAFSILSNPEYSTVVGLLLSSFRDFDARVPPNVLDPDWDTILPPPVARTTPQSGSAKTPGRSEEPSGSSPVSNLINRLKRGFLGDNNGNSDTY